MPGAVNVYPHSLWIYSDSLLRRLKQLGLGQVKATQRGTWSWSPVWVAETPSRGHHYCFPQNALAGSWCLEPEPNVELRHSVMWDTSILAAELNACSMFSMFHKKTLLIWGWIGWVQAFSTIVQMMPKVPTFHVDASSSASWLCSWFRLLVLDPGKQSVMAQKRSPCVLKHLDFGAFGDWSSRWKISFCVSVSLPFR